MVWVRPRIIFDGGVLHAKCIPIDLDRQPDVPQAPKPGTAQLLHYCTSLQSYVRLKERDEENEEDGVKNRTRGERG